MKLSKTQRDFLRRVGEKNGMLLGIFMPLNTRCALWKRGLIESIPGHKALIQLTAAGRKALESRA